MQKHFIYGVPGVGKTHYSKQLSQRLQIEVYELDQLRDKAKEEHKIEEKPFLYLGTTQAYTKFGELNCETAIQGLLAISDAMKPYVEILENHKI